MGKRGTVGENSAEDADGVFTAAREHENDAAAGNVVGAEAEGVVESEAAASVDADAVEGVMAESGAPDDEEHMPEDIEVDMHESEDLVLEN